jgi:hypothetical protein
MSGITQLVSVGAQDAFITGDPQVSFFQSVYRRHTNFSVFQKNNIFQGLPKAGGMSTVRFERFGDLLNYTFLTASLSGVNQEISDWTQVVDQVELLIGGQVIDTQTSEFCEEIAVDTLANTGAKSFPAGIHGGVGSASYFYPLRFFFCENWFSSIPLVALQYHDVELRIRWSSTLNAGYRCNLTSCYVMLDEQERVKMVNEPQEMLVTQVQKITPSNDKIQQLDFNHPIKFIASSGRSANALVSTTNKVKLVANGVDVTDFNISIPFYTAVPSYYHTEFSSSNAGNLFLYSFGLNTNRHQPSGSLNFSRLDSFQIHCDGPIDQNIYAVNYNVLRVQNGMAGLTYAN